MFYGFGSVTTNWRSKGKVIDEEETTDEKQ